MAGRALEPLRESDADQGWTVLIVIHIHGRQSESGHTEATLEARLEDRLWIPDTSWR